MFLAPNTCAEVVYFEPSSLAKSPAIRIKPPNSLRRSESLPRLPARRCASRKIKATADLSKCGISLFVPMSRMTS